uniref:C2H2-type domain-containing protein n=1 Tax=Meloidogyne incognita TaxID=6306 RepID=A0A914MIY8_MELIC
MREFIFDLCDKGIGAIASTEQLKDKFGEQVPTLCTIYKWRREYRGGKGEKQLLDKQNNINNTPESMVLQQNSAGRKAKNHVEKYCSACNREMSTRHYYEFHMLNVHDVLLGNRSATVELLEKMSSTRKQQLTFRCDSCFGRCIDYDNFEELQQHKLEKHGIEIPLLALQFKKNKNNSNNASPPGKMRAHPKLARSVTICRDKSLPLPPGGLRRSARIPKPTSAIIHSLLLAKDENGSESGEQIKKDSSKIHERSQILQGLKDEEAREDAELDDCIKGIKRRWGGGVKSTKNLSKINEINEELLQNNETKSVQEEEPFVTILNDGRIEVEETQIKKSRNVREKCLDPLMALASAALMEKNASAKAISNNKTINNNSYINSTTTETLNHTSSSYPSSTSSDNLKLNSLNSTTANTLSNIQSTTNNNKIKEIFREKKISATTKIDNKKQKKNNVGWNKGDKNEEENNKNKNLEDIQQQNNSEAFQEEEEEQQQVGTQNVENVAVEYPRDSASIENNNNNNNNNNIIIPASSQFFTLSAAQNQTALFVSQDDSTWFGQSVAAQLRLMPLHIKELAKMRIQQVIFECNSSTFASFHQFAQLQSKPQNSRSNDSPAATNFSTEQNNGIEQTLEINGDREENNEEVDVITVEEQQQKLNNETN